MPGRGMLGGNTGNLMGPNHPVFAPGGGLRQQQTPQPPWQRGGLPIGGPGTMQPRFDPLMPPGIGEPLPLPPGSGGGAPPSFGPLDGRRRPIPGEPNPDHLPPPNAFGSSSMFM